MAPVAKKKWTAAETERLVGLAFTDAQRSVSAHGHATRSLARVVESDDGAFLKAFLHALNRALMVFDRHPPVERVVTFVATLAAAHPEPFAMQVLAYLSEHAGKKSRAGKAVRFRAVQTIAAVISALPEDASLTDALWELLVEAGEARSRDKVARVRAAAAGALCRLQSSGDPQEDPVTARLVAMLSSDSTAAVRKSALNAVAVNDATLPFIVRRTRDISDDVRKAAYSVLAAKLDPSQLDVADRLELLKSGLGDRAAVVREVCATGLLLKGWLDGTCEGDVFALVDLLGGYEQDEVVLKALSIVFRAETHAHLLKEIKIDINNLTFSDVLVLRALSQIQKADSVLDEYIPDPQAYAEMLRYYAVDGFASSHLLALCRGLDLSDEGGRRELEATIQETFLLSTSAGDDTIKPAVKAMFAVMLSVESATRALTELARDYVLRVHDGESQMEEEPDAETQVWRERRALLICKEALLCGQHSRTASDGGGLSMYLELVQHAAVPQLMNPRVENRAVAFECLALFCMMDRTGAEAAAKIPLFLEACRKDELAVQEVALRALMDFLMACDLSRVGGIGEESQSSLHTEEAASSPRGNEMTNECMALISKFMTHIEGDLRSIAVSGTAKLLFCRRLVGSGEMLSRMLIAYHNPATEDDAAMRQCLSVFFPAYAHSGAANRKLLEGALLPTLRILHDAPSSSPLCTVNSGQTGQFIMHLIELGEEDASVTEELHAEIAENLLNEILDTLDDGASNEAVRVYCKIMAGMKTEDGRECNRMLLKLVDAVLEQVDDKRSSTALMKFRGKIGDHNETPR